MGERFCVSASVTKANGTRSSMSSRVFFLFFFEVNRERTSFHESSRLHLARVITRCPIQSISIFVFIDIIYIGTGDLSNKLGYLLKRNTCMCVCSFLIFLKGRKWNDSNSIKYCRSPLSSHTTSATSALIIDNTISASTVSIKSFWRLCF